MGDSVNKEIIASEQDLVLAASKLLLANGFAQVRLREAKNREQFDLLVRLALGSVACELLAACKLRLSVRDIARLAAQKLPGQQKPLLVTVKLTPSLVAECRRQGVSCLDLNGRIWISAKGLVIDRDVPLGRTRYVLRETPVNFFSPKSSRIARALSSFPERAWKQADLAELTQLSKGLVSRLLNYAVQQGWVEDKRGAWRLVKLDALLSAWEDVDEFRARVSIRQYSTLEPDFRILAQRLVEGLPGELAFTQWFAASLRYPYTTPPALSVYRRQFPSDEEAKRLHLRDVADGGKIWILAPRDEGVFQTVRQVQGFPLVCDAQIYLDLIHAGLRGDDQAKALRGWEGFCKT